MMTKEAQQNPEAFRRPESVLVVVHTVAGEVLLLQRTDQSQAWQSITGSMHWHEQLPVDTARRELFEETGLSAADNLKDWQQSNRYPIHPLWKHRYHEDQNHNLEHIFSLCVTEPVEIVMNPEEHSSYCWQPYSAALDRVRFETNRTAIQCLMDNA